MKKITTSLALILPLFLSACGGNDFSGSYYSDQMGVTSEYIFDNGELRITSSMGGSAVINYEYNEDNNEILLTTSEDMPKQIIKIHDDGSLNIGPIELTRYPDTDILSGGAWIAKRDTVILSMVLKKVSDQEMQAEINQLSLNPGDKTYSRQEGPGVTDNAVLEGRDLTLQEEGSTMRVTAISNDKMVLTFGQENMTFLRHDEGYDIIPEGYTQAK